MDWFYGEEGGVQGDSLYVYDTIREAGNAVLPSACVGRPTNVKGNTLPPAIHRSDVNSLPPMCPAGKFAGELRPYNRFRLGDGHVLETSFACVQNGEHTFTK